MRVQTHHEDYTTHKMKEESLLWLWCGASHPHISYSKKIPKLDPLPSALQMNSCELRLAWVEGRGPSTAAIQPLALPIHQLRLKQARKKRKNATTQARATKQYFVVNSDPWTLIRVMTWSYHTHPMTPFSSWKLWCHRAVSDPWGIFDICFLLSTYFLNFALYCSLSSPVAHLTKL